MTAVMPPTLFDLEDAADEWAPIYERRIEDEGWHWSEGGGSMPLHADGTPVTKAEWKAHDDRRACRDCGSKSGLNQGGSDGPEFAWVCDECARLDCAKIRAHRAARCEPRPGYIGHWTAVADCQDCGWEVWSERFVSPVGSSMELEPMPDEEIERRIAHHRVPRWSSRWGTAPHELDEHDGLIAAQQKRRAAYLRKQWKARGAQ